MKKLKETSETTNIRIDVATHARLRALAGGMAMSTFLRQLTSTLTLDKRATLEDMSGGYSLVPIRRDMKKLQDMLVAVSGQQLKLMDNIEDLTKVLKHTLQRPERMECGFTAFVEKQGESNPELIEVVNAAIEARQRIQDEDEAQYTLDLEQEGAVDGNE